MTSDDATYGMRETRTERVSHHTRMRDAENAAKLAYERLQVERTSQAKDEYEAAWSLWIELMMSRTPLHHA